MAERHRRRPIASKELFTFSAQTRTGKLTSRDILDVRAHLVAWESTHMATFVAIPDEYIREVEDLLDSLDERRARDHDQI